MTRALRFAVLGVATLATTLLLACGGDSNKGTSPAGSTGQSSGAATQAVAAGPARQAAADTLVVAWTGDLNSMDPPFSLVEWNRELTLNVYEMLVNYKFKERADGALVWEGLEVAPGLAESWTVDGPAVMFKLRKGAKFYPSGNDVTADDVKWSFDRTINVPGGFGKFNANLAGIFDAQKQVEVIDPKTVKITFTDSQGNPILLPASLPSMRFPQFAIIDSKAVKAKVPADDPWGTAFLKENVVGSGPYYVEKRTPGQETALKTVPNYDGKKPAFDRVILRVIKDPADILALMKRGEVDASTGLGMRELNSLQEAGFTILNAPIPNIVRVDMTMDRAPLDKKEIRQALAYAMPYDTILKNVFGGRGERATSFVNPQSPGFLDSFKTYQTDPNKAKDLLTKAGVGSGLQVDIFYDSGIPSNEDIALLIQDALRKINVTANLKAQPTTQYAADRTARAKGEPVQIGLTLAQAVIWLDDPDPNTDVWIKSNGTSNATGYKSAQADQLHLQNRFSSDAKARKEAYEKIQQMVADDVPMIPLLVTGRNAAMNPKITGFSFTADPHNRFWTLKLK
jgi:peptide/nickel transport system substrate-binding protein